MFDVTRSHHAAGRISSAGRIPELATSMNEDADDRIPSTVFWNSQ
jgi:hypothetical protein